MIEAKTAVEDVQWYTPARKVPRYIGKPPGGGTYPFGPYTITQFVGGALVFAIGAFTESWWGGSSWLVNKALLVGATAAFIAVAKVVKPGGRSPLLAVPSYAWAVVGAPHGRYRGKRVKPPRPRRVHGGTIHVCLDGLPIAQPTGSDDVGMSVDARLGSGQSGVTAARGTRRSERPTVETAFGRIKQGQEIT